MIRLVSGQTVLNRSTIFPDSDGYYRLSNYDHRCFRHLKFCASHGWTLRFQLLLNPFDIVDRERKSLLLSTGAHEPHSDGILIYLYQSKNISHLEFGLKEFRNDEFAYYWQVEVDIELGQWIDVVLKIEQKKSSIGEHQMMSLYFDGHFYKETPGENYTELSIFEYEHIYPKSTLIYGNDSGLVIFRDLILYERILTDEEIANGMNIKSQCIESL